TVAALCEVAAAYELVIICDEIYRDLVHDPATPLLSPTEAAPARTVITTGASKNLALGGWRIGVARMPAGPLGRRPRPPPPRRPAAGALAAGGGPAELPRAPPPGRSGPRLPLPRPPADLASHRVQPCPACQHRPRRRRRVHRRRAGGPAAAGRLLRLPRLRP